MHAKYIATPEEDLAKYENALNLAATLVSNLYQKEYKEDDPSKDESGKHISWDEDFDNLKEALLELGYEIK